MSGKEKIEQNIKKCLDSIGNLKPELYEKLFNELYQHSSLNNFVKMRKHIVQKLKIPSQGRYCKQYWISRGWTIHEARYKTKELYKNRKNVNHSPYSREFWTSKINPKTNKNYTIEEADFERNSRRPTNKEYWILKGYSLEDAEQKAKAILKSNSEKGIKNANPEIYKSSSRFTKTYWTLRGLTEEEAIVKISELQKTFSLELCIKKFGKKKGQEIWKKRQEKWLDTLNKKSDQEKKEINRKKNILNPERFETTEDLINCYEKLFNNRLFRTEKDLIDNIIFDINKNINKKYWSPEKYIKSIPKVQFEVLKINRIELKEKIKHLFNSGSRLVKNGTIQNYVLWVDEGLLRSSFEIEFYNQIKNINPKAIVGLDKCYPNSKLRYDFLLDNGDYIEICPILKENNNISIIKKYSNNINKKIKLFKPILINSSDQLLQYIEKYKNDFNKRSKQKIC